MSSTRMPSRAEERPDRRISALRTTFRTLGPVAPRAAAAWAERIFCSPPRQATRPHEEAFLATGRAFTVDGGGMRLRAWEWGEGPLVLLVHGWGSRAGRWAALAPRLVADGYRVVTFDAPGHGRTPGRTSSLPAFADALMAMGDALGPAHGVAGHSLGGAAIALALHRGLGAGRAVLIASPSNPETFADRFAATLSIPPAVRDRMQANLERRLQIKWKDLHIPTLAAGLSAPAFVIHDRDDTDVGVDEATAIAAAWPGAELLLTSGLGHRGIIRDPDVLARTAAFLGRSP
ncbi:MAG TPA: alpha/beta fold hydrolase [Gemmatimonadales bacterium]|nr:alpha/beta fold hydrolase [Gemmatimonadales bacterium]